MRQLVPVVTVVLVSLTGSVRAQAPSESEDEELPALQLEQDTRERREARPRRPADDPLAEDESEGGTEGGTPLGDDYAPPPPPPPPPTQPSGSPVVPPPIVDQAYDEERALPPTLEVTTVEEPVGTGLRMFMSLQLNAVVGELVEDGSGGFPFERATLTGVPDVIVGLRYGRFTAGLGATWSLISQPTEQVNFCTGATESFDNSQALFGVLPTARGDFLLTEDGRARFEAGATIPLLLATRSTELNSGDCSTGGRRTDESTDGVYGVDAHIGGRYHIWPALSVGLELGLSVLVFDQDDNPDTDIDEPSVTTVTVYSGLNIALEIPL